jgi:hypothetical protein
MVVSMTTLTKGTAKRIRKNYPDLNKLGPQSFPEPKWEWVRTYSHGIDGWKVGMNHGAHILGWLAAQGFRLIRKADYAGQPYPTKDELIEELEEYARRNSPAGYWMHYYDMPAKGRAYEDLERLVGKAAAFCLTEYDPAKARKDTARGKYAKSKVRRKARPWDLRRSHLIGQSKREQAKRLGVSERTVAYYRAINAKQDAKQARELAWADMPWVSASTSPTFYPAPKPLSAQAITSPPGLRAELLGILGITT